MAHGVANDSRAIARSEPLAESGNADAQVLMGVMHEDGQGSPERHAEAAKWYTRRPSRANAVAGAFARVISIRHRLKCD